MANLGVLMGATQNVDGSNSVKAKRDPGKKKLKSITIEIVDNGYTVSERYVPADARKGEPYQYIEPTEKVASSQKELDEILDDCLGLSKAYKDDDTK